MGADSWGFPFTLACNLSFFGLFLHFYFRTYADEKKTATVKKVRTD